ncbi:MAG: hypothetical protein HZB54_01930 [Deltaproteobacteria bacterium]|nr:hypothetical protein [Deltaproteobacteria bacterium]
MKVSKCRSVVVSEVNKRTETEKGRSGEISFSFLLLFTVSCFLFAVSLTACGKKEEPVKEETKISVVEKKAEVAPSAETISAEAYKGALVVSDVTGVN